MTDIELSRRIHELRGFDTSRPCKCGNPAHYRDALGGLRHIPDYPNDLNACHEVVKGLERTELLDYWTYLTDDMPQNDTFGPEALRTDAPARQRAEALLYTLAGEQP